MRKLKLSPISISLSPNVQKEDVFLSWKLVFCPYTWKKGKKIKELESWFKKYFGVEYAFSFNSGRSAMMAILYSMGIKSSDEILIQSYTCNAVPNPIMWSGARPVYVDICGTDNLNIDPDDLEKKITINSRAIVVQHTFGFPADMEKIADIAKRHSLKIIEDCAHSLGAEYEGKKIGTFGSASFFSFGRDKIVSSVFGGMAVTNDQSLAEKIEEFQKECKYPSTIWILKQVLHPIIFSFSLPVYYMFGFGKLLIWFFQKIGLLSKAVIKDEKSGVKPHYFPKKMPNALAVMAIKQLEKLDKFNKHRMEISELYQNKLETDLFKKKMGRPSYLKYPIIIEKPKEIIRRAKKRHIILDDGWAGGPVVPLGTDLEKMDYNMGSCPKAEELSKNILNLPTHINISIEDAKEIIKCIQSEK